MPNVTSNRRLDRWSGFGLAQALALALFGACSWWVYREFALAFANHPVLPSIGSPSQLGARVLWNLAAFALAAWIVHAVLGVLAFVLARLTESALPAPVVVRRSLLVTGWFTLLAGLAFAANSTLHPASLFAGEVSIWRQSWSGLPRIVWIALGLLLVILFLAWRSRGCIRQPTSVSAIAITFLVVACASMWLPLQVRTTSPRKSEDLPHIVIIGIDSLRKDLSLPSLGSADAPAIREFLAAARRFEDVTSPLARTYGAWVSILTGRHPATTNARVNLMPRHLVLEGQTLPQALQAAGYGTVYATDETRFANFDASFGFDQMVMPPVGAADFLLGYAGDMPLVNLVAATPFGQILFPSHYANRAAFVTYRPSHFVRRVQREVTFVTPTFLAVHLTLAHWPYAWAGTSVPSQPAQYRAAYAKAVEQVDRQFGELMRLLAARGVLDNAIVVLLSDHGEALGADDDSMLRKVGTSREVWDSLWGHGTSVMSPYQYQVILGIRAFGRARLPGPETDYAWAVSLEDLRPTLEALATGNTPVDVDGVSLAPFMADPQRARELATRVRFTETDFNTPRTLAGEYEVSGIVDEAALNYEIDAVTGWVQFREERLPQMLAAKQRAAVSTSHVLAAIPGPPGTATRYLFTERREPNPTTLEGPPEAWKHPEARRLWQALQARFPGELPPAPAVQ